ncbi:hypothetical protein V8J36_04945 [Frigidibacter sp. MR17.14]|uniref:hypothetical protein n=1 Tax=Frigidibacter sp. MR17.14 TaxID=3126509 RepID=UPI003012E561
MLALLAGTALPGLAQVIAVDPPRPSDRPEDLRLIFPDATPRAVARTPRPRTRPENPLELQLPVAEVNGPAGGTGLDALPEAGGFALPPPWSFSGADGAPAQPAAPGERSEPPPPTRRQAGADHDGPTTRPAPGLPAVTAESAPAADMPAPHVAPPPPKVPPPHLDLAQFGRDDFLKDRARLASAYVEAAASGEPARRAGAAMDFATFYLAHQLLPEGRSIIAAVDPAGLSEDDAARRDALDLALRLAAGETVPLDAAPLVAFGPGVWQDRPLWAALAGYRAGNADMITATLPDALEMLDHTPPQFSEPLLLPLLDAAIIAGQWNLSGAIAERIAARPALKDSPGYDFLLGKASAASGQPEAAFDAYARAAAGEGEAAQRARLALADLGIAAGGASLRQTADMLTSVRYDWRGGPLELGLLDRLARTEERIGNAPSALRWYGQILSLFAGTSEAQHAEERSHDLLRAVYDDGAAGRIEIGTFLRLHRNIAPDFRRIDGFDREAEKLGDRLLALGASAAASEEYAGIRKALEDARDAGLWEVTTDRMTAIKLKEADALLRGGQVPEALALLSPVGPGLLAPETERRLAELRAETLWAAGQIAELAAQPLGSSPAAGALRRIADARFQTSDWHDAVEAYRALWHDHPRDFAFADAARLFLSAHRAGETEVATAVAAAFPDLEAGDDWRVVAESILAEPAPLSPLRDAAIDRRMQRSEETVTRLKALQDVSAQADPGSAAGAPAGGPATSPGG